MAWSYEKLWIMLVKKKLKRIDLIRIAGINAGALAHMGKDEPVTMNALGKICEAFHCRLEDIVEYIPESVSEEVQE
ncbi:helix-turn-helix transcriptional regulator [uncultured Oscillibacter sp.]|uniref:helix-turn-helix domain-containing protein n=1 Tax=uncultured Oscillibacter sp. TaxID=876091 RepID=UPI0025DBD131|nr:helix-turn-helix transcriptional regulator [uncultured Oscillibacter sp.]